MSGIPPGACDTHLHFYDSLYPVAPTTVLRPPDASAEQYREVQSVTGTERLVVVQPTTYGLDNSCQLAALAQFGDRARGVMVVDEHVETDELVRLDGLGVRGARFHMLPGGAVDWPSLEPVAERIAPMGWHIQLQLNGRELPQHLDRLLALPVELVVDHVGRFTPPVPTDHDSFAALATLMDTGRSWVKLSAPYESSTSAPPDHTDVWPLIDALVAGWPDRLVWASNWPHPGQRNPPTPDRLVSWLYRWLPTPDTRHQVLVDNPTTLYAF